MYEKVNKIPMDLQKTRSKEREENIKEMIDELNTLAVGENMKIPKPKGKNSISIAGSKSRLDVAIKMIKKDSVKNFESITSQNVVYATRLADKI